MGEAAGSGVLDEGVEVGSGVVSTISQVLKMLRWSAAALARR